MAELLGYRKPLKAHHLELLESDFAMCLEFFANGVKEPGFDSSSFLAGVLSDFSEVFEFLQSGNKEDLMFSFPRSMYRFLPYDKYLETYHWQRVRTDVYVMYDGCSYCAAKATDSEVHAHHRTYLSLGRERVGDVVLLCAQCHEVFHKHRHAEGQRNAPAADWDEVLSAEAKKHRRLVKEVISI